MKRIVDIPDEMYDWIDNGFPTEDDYAMLWEKIRQGIPFLEELEKINTEIEEIDNIVHEHGATYINKYGIVKVFNKHIAELKGENNG